MKYLLSAAVLTVASGCAVREANPLPSARAASTETYETVKVMKVDPTAKPIRDIRKSSCCPIVGYAGSMLGEPDAKYWYEQNREGLAKAFRACGARFVRQWDAIRFWQTGAGARLVGKQVIIAKNSDTGDLYEIDSLSDDDVKIINDFHANSDIFDDEDKVSDSSDDDLSDEDLKYFEKMKGNVEAPSASAIAAAGSAESILDESPIVNSCFEDDAPTPEERLRMKIDSLRAGEVFVHKLYGEGEVIDNSDSEVIQVRFGRDLRFLKKEKLARKDLVVM